MRRARSGQPDDESGLSMKWLGTKHACPVWIGHLLASPIRKWIHDPRTILGPHIQPGMCVMDVGSAMGFFSLPIAERVGQDGRVICVDVQQGMIDALRRRARRVNVLERLELRLCTTDSLRVEDLAGRVDFAVVFAMVHEVADPARLFRELHAALKPGGRLLFTEPKGHVTRTAFRNSMAAAEAAGFRFVGAQPVRRCHAAVLEKGATG